MTIYREINGKKKIKKRWKALFIVVTILVALGIFIGSFSLYNYIKRDYKKGNHDKYLNNLDSTSSTLNKKNVIIILLDDMGYGDLSITGSQAISTPNIDKLANDGILFTNYYSPNPICSASRAGMLTGRYPLRTLTCGAYMDTEVMSGHFASFYQCLRGTYPFWNTGLPTDEVLLPEVLQKVGYSTSLFGKWHLGVKDEELPNNRGFDYFLGALYSDDMKPYRVYENKKVLHSEPYDQSNLTKELTTGMVNYISENKNNPFFLYYASPFPHYPANCSEEWKGSSKGGTYGDCMQEVDWSVGQIVSTLETEGILDDTLILFTSDNGPWYEGATDGQRGRKATKYNGGSHVPFIAYMHNTLTSRVDDSLISGLDFFPTILSMIGIELPKDRIIDGIDMWSAWLGKEEAKRTQLFINDEKDSFAMVKGHYKYIERCMPDNAHYWNLKQGPFLYDMETDPEEAYDVTSLYPEIAEEMKTDISNFKKELNKNYRGWISE